MGELTCDDCGTINDDSRSSCELCGGSLSEEKESRDRLRDLLVAPLAWLGLTVVFFLVCAGDFLWTKARYSANPSRRPSGFDLMEMLQHPSQFAIPAAIVTVLVVGGIAATRSTDEDDA